MNEIDNEELRKQREAELMNYIMSPDRDLSPQVEQAALRSSLINPNSDEVNDQVALRRLLVGGGGNKVPIFMPGGVQINTYDPAERKRRDEFANEPYTRALKQKELAGEDLQRMTQAQNVMDLQGARKTQNLQRLEAAKKMAEEIQRKRAENDPNSELSKADSAAFQQDLQAAMDRYATSKHPSMSKIVPQLQALKAASAGKSKLQIDALRKSAQASIDDARQLSAIDVNKDLGGTRNYISLQGVNERIRHDQETEEQRKAAAEARAAQVAAKLDHSFKNAKNDNGTLKALEKITVPHTVATRIDNMKNTIAANKDKVGWMKKIETAIKTPIGQQSPEDAKLIADLAFIYQPYRKKNFGVPSAGDNAIVAQYFPMLQNNPDAFMAQLQSFRDDNNYQVYNGLSDLVTTYSQDLGISPEDVTPENAYSIYSKIKGNISKAAKGGSVEKIDTKAVNNNSDKNTLLDWLNKNQKQAGSPKYQAMEKIARTKGYIK